MRLRTLAAPVLVALASLALPTPLMAAGRDPVDTARAKTKHRHLPKAKPEAVGTPPIITRPGSSVAGTPAPSKARRKSEP